MIKTSGFLKKQNVVDEIGSFWVVFKPEEEDEIEKNFIQLKNQL